MVPSFKNLSSSKIQTRKNNRSRRERERLGSRGPPRTKKHEKNGVAAGREGGGGVQPTSATDDHGVLITNIVTRRPARIKHASTQDLNHSSHLPTAPSQHVFLALLALSLPLLCNTPSKLDITSFGMRLTYPPPQPYSTVRFSLPWSAFSLCPQPTTLHQQAEHSQGLGCG